ncbi:MAG: diguanylate cyclase domain-containing protein, partial [Christensenellaceae bacterium]
QAASASEHGICCIRNFYDASSTNSVLGTKIGGSPERRKTNVDTKDSCKKGYSRAFPGLCELCRQGSDPEGEQLEVTDEDGRLFSVIQNEIIWLDEKPATIFFLKDVDEERKIQENLYNLAYIDHLTGIPNRQKLKGDFEEIREDIENGLLDGVLALFDLDNFKTINDTYGHNAGDVLLRRLADHLVSDEKYKGHLYRLGGDEFIFLFYDTPGRFQSEDDRKKYYEDLLMPAFLSYSMPNLEKACTISMGVSFFPNHGTTFSELLRKADIALYEAKNGGRNQLVFFEDRYDTAQKFKDLYINIQPILIKSGKTYGYELIDRGNEENQEEDEALNLSEFDRTLDALGLNDLEGDARYFISYSKQLLNPAVLGGLPKDKFIIQVQADKAVKELDTYKELKAHGYQFAITDLKSTNVSVDLLELGDYFRFEPGGMSDVMRKRIIQDHGAKKFIAAEVNTQAQFDAAKIEGFKLFQGYFFRQQLPVTKKTKDIEPLKVNYYRLLKLTSTDDYVDFQEISAIISSDVALSYKLLKLLNSAAVGLRSRVSSISMAVAYLGEENLKKWIALLALRGVASDKPLELVRLSLIRAQFGELLAPYYKPRKDAKHAFLVGLLSLLHIALEKPKEELLAEVPVSEDIRDSLLTKSGPYSDLIQFFNDYEYSNWDAITRFAEEYGMTSEFISDSYIAAVRWYNDLANE